MLSKEHKTLVKYFDKKVAVWYEELLVELPNKHWPLTTVKCLQWKIDDTGTVNRQVNLAVKENEKLFEQKYRPSTISAICC